MWDMTSGMNQIDQDKLTRRPIWPQWTLDMLIFWPFFNRYSLFKQDLIFLKEKLTEDTKKINLCSTSVNYNPMLDNASKNFNLFWLENRQKSYRNILVHKSLVKKEFLDSKSNQICKIFSIIQDIQIKFGSTLGKTAQKRINDAVKFQKVQKI